MSAISDRDGSFEDTVLRPAGSSPVGDTISAPSAPEAAHAPALAQSCPDQISPEQMATLVPVPSVATRIHTPSVPAGHHPTLFPRAAPVPSSGLASLARNAGLPPRVGPYEILEMLGEGGMGVVYLARQAGLDRPVALKVMRARGGDDGLALRRFQREAQAAARLRHPGIVAVHEVGADGDQHYYSMEYVLGQSLEELRKSEKLTPRRSLELTETVARTLAYAHAEGVIHRDIKPQNILITSDGRPLLADFGLARDLSRESVLTQEGSTLGTPAYMPPEQALGNVDQVDGRCDVYSLGAVLYHLLTGSPPFSGETPFEVIRQVVMDLPVPVRRLVPAVHPDIETICLKCLEKARERRYPSAEALADDIHRFVEGLPIVARPISLAGRAVRAVRRNAWAWMGTAAVALALSGTAFWQRWQESQHAEQFGRATGTFQRASEEWRAAEGGDRGAWRAALGRVRAVFEEVVRDHPDYPEVRLAAADAAERAGDFGAADRHLDALAKRDPDDLEAAYRTVALWDAIIDLRLPASLPDACSRGRIADERLARAADDRWAPRAQVRRLTRGRRGAEAVAAAAGLLADPVDRSDTLALWLAAHGVAEDLEAGELLAQADAWVALDRMNPAAWRERARILFALNRDRESADAWKACIDLQTDPCPYDLEAFAHSLDKAHDGREVPELRAALEDLAKRYPGRDSGWRSLAEFHRKAGRLEESAECLRKAGAVSDAPLEVAAEEYLTIRSWRGPAEAAALLDRVLREHPPEAEVKRHGAHAVDALVGSLVESKEYDAARAILARAVDSAPDRGKVLELMGSLEFSQGREEKAIEYLDAAIAAGERQAGTHAKRARVLRRLRRYDAAIKDLEQAVELAPARRNLRAQLAALYGLAGHFAAAVRELAEVIYLTPTLELEVGLEAMSEGRFDVFSGKGKSLEPPADEKDAERALLGSAVRGFLPKVAEALVKKGAAVLEIDPARAERCFSAAVACAPAHPEPYVRLARLHARAESWMAAILALEKAAELGYKKFDTLFDQEEMRPLLHFPRVRRLREGK